MHKETVFLGELTRKELGDAIGNGTVKAAIVPTGATEQHQDHLAMIHDTVSVTEISRRVAMRFYPHVLVTPTIAMSVSEHHMSRGGALTVRPEIHAEHVYDICHSLKRLGVSRVMVVNGHGGNRPPVRCEVRNWWQIKSVIAIADEVFGDAEGFHATPSEVALTYYGYPDDAARVKKNKLIPKRAPQGPIYDAEDYRRRFPDGRIGSDPGLATEEIGERLLEAAVAELSADYQAFLAAP